MRKGEAANNRPFIGVGICIATYNAAAFITHTLDSILAQTFEDFRIIISDDASSDDTVEICQCYARTDSRITVVPHSQRLGWVKNVNRALRVAEGQYLMITSHDDVIEPDYIALLVEGLERNPGASVAFSDMFEHTLEGELRLHSFDACEGLISPTERALKILGKKSWWTPYRGVFRYSVYREIGGLQTHWGGEFSADKPWVLRLALAGEFVRIPKALYHKHRKPSSLAKSWDYSAKANLTVLCACFRAVWESRLSIAQAWPIYRLIFRRMLILLRRDMRKRYAMIVN